MTSDPTIAGYHAASTSAVFFDRSARARLDVSGPDRAKFLHNLTTQEVKHLKVEEGGEGFVTSPQGKTLGYVTLLATDNSILVRTEPESVSLILPHLRKYGVFDDVTIDDLSPQTFEFHLAGPTAEAVLRAAGMELPEAGDLRHSLARIGSTELRAVRESPLGRPGLTLIGARSDAECVASSLHQAGMAQGLTDLDPSAFEVLRIEAGVPASGRDVTPDNLPQEVARDSQAINFVKGCYLGQETVARIDALGHVNKLLRGIIITGDRVPPPGSQVEGDGKVVGTVTSAAISPARGCVVALAYVRTSHAKAGTSVRVRLKGGDPVAETIDAVVSDLPMPPP
jgi:folate-binding protein YgfZ